MKKLELIRRSLGLRHKLKVHESMKQPDTHEDLAIMLLAKWEFEDELKAIEELLGEARSQNVQIKRSSLTKDIVDQAVENLPELPNTIEDADSLGNRIPAMPIKKLKKRPIRE